MNGPARTASKALPTIPSAGLPALPADQYQPSILARPSFENAHMPAGSYMFFGVNALLLAAIAVGAWLDLDLNQRN